ncbi:DEAD/DEAH box helicase family protein [Clostridium tagluense]|uniref:DEAD/DEAH box helicase family protein n=1 Tax=Clostridium tagluense TaxID=360422 RepID=UPI001CF45246|nr:DEAD/DEAH box helicase family protein [Clostridium tagluense]MCB2300633.1 DEAD/DEAH box helicase family protein [Clostridium tagluense]MCB2311636.1 DEAD/DEAH box helicase family protein [Clostridium tagluense]MCB2316360.1 DEAD/DEAH box helicase family protein [Clostridium tagluense]MCB2321256.1 DEAD/DEAH box helicase family protein [Clostridium tagluense]MCB2326229.1 DEAD/DEAH box helicase family protein [Clostridium tagluense]
MEDKNKLWLYEAMLKYEKKFQEGVLNVLNAPAGCGKTTFIFDEFLKNTKEYVNGVTINFEYTLNKVLYVCDTSMLQDSVLNENEGFTKALEKGDLSKAKDDITLKKLLEGEDYGDIKVITYSKLGMLLKNEACKYLILNHFNCIIMDEMHNLFIYANKFDSDDNIYGTVLECLPSIISKVLTIGVSATPSRISSYAHNTIQTHTIFTNEELKAIKSFNANYIQTNDIMNWIKLMPYLKSKHLNEKIYIYTNTINQSKKYKEFLNNNGFKAEWLCSINNKTEIKSIDDEGNEIVEKIPTMNEYQVSIRAGLLKFGMLPNDLDVLIVNGAYETGWNLKDDSVQTVFVDNTCNDTQIQARNRVRHDIKRFFIKVKTEKNYLKDYVVEYCWHLRGYWAEETMNYMVLFPKLKKLIGEEYIGKKLTNEDKKYLVENFAMKWCSKKSVTWQTFKIDLDLFGFVVKTFKGKNNGTYIFREGQEIIRDSIKEVKKMDGEELIINWLSNRWDKERMPCNEVRDILDFGRKTWNNLIKSKSITDFLNDNRITMKSIKGMGKTLYFKTY